MVEFYDKGEDITAKDIYFEGLFDASFDFNFTITQGNVNVIYSSVATDLLPNYTFCLCTQHILKLINVKME